MPNSFDPRKYQDSGARFQAWQAAGSPGEDMYGNALDTRGEVANLMFDPNYVAANKNSFSNYNGKSDWLQTYFSPQNQGLTSFMRQGGVVDPWAKTFMGNNPSGGGQVPGGVSMPGPTPQPMTAPPGPGGTSMPAPNPIPHGGPGQPPPSPITTGTLPNRGGTSTSGPSLGSRGPSSANPILIASGATGGVAGQPTYTPPINVAGGAPKAGTPIAGPSGGKEEAGGQAWHGGPVYANTNAGQPTSGTAATQPAPNPAGGQIGVDQNSGMLTFNGQVLDRYDSRLWGTSGEIWRRGPNTQQGFRTQQSYDPNYFEEYIMSEDDAGIQYGYRLRPEIMQRLNGRVQLSQAGVGGYSEVLDPSQVTYDPEFGFLTTPDNIGAPDGGGLSGWLNSGGLMALLAAGGLGAIAQAGGFAGMFGGSTPTAGGTITGTGALPTSAAPVVSGTLAGAPVISGAGAAAGAGAGGLTLSQIISALRTGGSAAGLISQLTGGGPSGSGGPSGNGSGGGNNSGGGLGGTLAQLIQGGLGNYQANHNIGNFNTMINEMLTRGDPYAGERASAIQRLRALEANPGSITSNPLFQNMNDKSQADLQRIFAARGLNISGNEMGGLQENFLANMNKFYGEEWNRIAREAGVFFDPGQIAAAGMQGAGRMFGARQNRDMVSNAVLQRILGSGGGGLNISNIIDFVNNLFGGSDGGDNTDEAYDIDGGMTDEEWNSWWDSYIEGNYGGDNPVGDAGDYNG